MGRILGDRYRVTNLVSAGANTLVADADDLALGRTVTIKLVRPDWAESAEFRRAFDHEMRKISALSHPNLAAVHDWGEETVGKRTTVYLVVEHLSGGSLRDLLDRGRSLDPSQALLVGLEACRGLDFAHRKHLVHTELTPSKLVFGDDRRLRIVDFGLARLLGELGWQEPATLPTHVARYASPEQALEQPISGKSDVYSLALILLEAVTGSVPFAARSTVATLSARIGRLMPVSADMGPLASLLERAGRPDPADRATAAQLGRGLVAAAAKLPRPKPIPILVSRLDEDPQRLRRPNDPTGGIARPPADPPAPVVPPVAPTPAPAPTPPPTGPEAERYPEDDDEALDVPVAEVAEAPPVEAAATVEGDGTAAPVEAAAPATGEGAAAPVTPPVEAVAPIEGDDTDAPIGAPIDAAAPADAVPAEPEPEPEPTAVIDPATPGPALAPPPTTDERELPAAPEEAAAIAAVAPSASEPTPNPDLATLVQPSVEVAPDDPAARDVPAGAVPSRRIYDGDKDATKDELAKLATAPPEEATVAMPMAPGPPSPADVDEAPRRRRWLIALVGILLLGALAGLAVLAYVLFQTPTHPVPDVEGQTLEEAEALIADFDWEVEVTNERSDEQPVEGAIIRTEPEAGRDLGEGEPFLIVLSEGPEFRALPELAGMKLADAETELARLRLTPLPSTEAYDETVPAGSVISWSVPDDPDLAAGSEVLPGTEIAVVVSQGPTPRIVPDFAGMTVEEAETLLVADRLQIEVGAAVFSDTVPNGEIVSSNPAAGTAVPRDSTVVVVPSKGVDLVAVPDLSRMTLPQARQALTRAGLQVGTVIGNSQGRFAVASVQGDDVEAGARIKRNSAVDLAFI